MFNPDLQGVLKIISAAIHSSWLPQKEPVR